MLKPDSEEWITPKLCKLLEKHITALEMAGGNPHPVQAPMKSTAKYTQGGMLGQSLNTKSTAGGLLASSHKASWSRDRIPNVSIVVRVTGPMSISSL